MNPTAVSIGLIGIAILGAIFFTMLVRLLNGQDAHTLTLAALGGKVKTHDTQIAGLAAELGHLKDFLRVDVHTEDVADDWAEQEPAGDDTEEFPAVAPDTEPMRVVPTLVEDVALARALAEIEDGFREFMARPLQPGEVVM